MASPVIELCEVDVKLGRETLLRHISCAIESGEKFVLIGPSGHGKTTLLKTMAGLIQPTRGEVLVEGQNLLQLDAKKRQVCIGKMGMLFQKNALFDSLTCSENIAFPLRELSDFPEHEIQRKAQHFLEAVGIGHARDLYPDEISGGMQKRLGIARALALSPQIVFYDDPTAGLDPITSRKIVELILKLQRELNSTVIAITNDMNRAYQMADRIGMVVNGELLITGTVAQTRAHRDPRVVQFIQGQLSGPLTVQA